MSGEKTRSTLFSVMGLSILLHVIIGIGATFWVITKYFATRAPVFEVRRELSLPVKEREHKMNMAAMASMMPKPVLNSKMLTTNPAKIMLPVIESVKVNPVEVLDPGKTMSNMLSALAGGEGVGMGGDGAGGVGGTGEGNSFFGVVSGGKRILLIVDISMSVMNKAEASGIAVTKIREEAMKLIEGLSINTRFGMIQMSQNYKVFQGELIPATQANREKGVIWVEEEWVESGTLSGRKVVKNPAGLVGVLELAARMQPDTVFLVSDGSFQWRVDGAIKNIPEKDLERSVEKLRSVDGMKTKIYFLGFQVKETDQVFWRKQARGAGGVYREVSN